MNRKVTASNLAGARLGLVIQPRYEAPDEFRAETRILICNY